VDKLCLFPLQNQEEDKRKRKNLPHAKINAPEPVRAFLEKNLNGVGPEKSSVFKKALGRCFMELKRGRRE